MCSRVWQSRASYDVLKGGRATPSGAGCTMGSRTFTLNTRDGVNKPLNVRMIYYCNHFLFD